MKSELQVSDFKIVNSKGYKYFQWRNKTYELNIEPEYHCVNVVLYTRLELEMVEEVRVLTQMDQSDHDMILCCLEEVNNLYKKHIFYDDPDE